MSAGAAIALLLVVTNSVPDLEAVRWHSRVLLLFAAQPQDSRLEDQRQRIEANAAGFTERDLKVFALTGPEAGGLREKYRVKAGEFAVVLVGKDGGEKLRSASPVDPKKLFGVIDAMPMRRSEMKSR